MDQMVKHSHEAMGHESMHNTASTVDDMGMKMYFHFDLGDTILFKNLIVNSDIQLLVTCIVFLLISITYEGLRYYRQFVLKKNLKFYELATVSSRLQNGNGDLEAREGADNTEQWRRSNINNLHIYQTFLHIIQVAFSYTLMLGFMTFNVWICLAILLGAGIGYFLFFKCKLNCDIVTEHCH